MSFLAKFFLDGSEYNVIHFQQGVQQKTDYSGKPTSQTANGIFSLTIESTSDEQLVQWMMSETMMKRGMVTFTKRNDPGKLYDFEFADAFCIGYEENYNHKNAWPITTKITISAGIVRNRGAIYERPWKVSNLSGNTSQVITNSQEPSKKEEPQKEPTIQQTYFIDENGNKIEEAVVGTTVSLIVNTKDMEGKSIDIDLSDNSKDFKYNGNLLENDRIEGVKVSGTEMKIDLEVIPQNS